MSASHLIILGAGGMAREVLWYARALGINDIALVDETVPPGSSITCGQQQYRIVNDWDEFERRAALAPYRDFIVAVGDPALKRRLTSSALRHGLTAAPTIIHRDAHIYGDDCSIGKGGVIAPGCRLTTNIVVGDFVTLGINCAIGHDAVIGDFVTCNPGCQVSGNVTLGAGVLIGTGACVKEKTTIAENVTVGAQACVIKNVEERDITLVGVPAARLKSTR
jgi:sugar O-acyltransferase (sialic acid O-acetyltransferase NeuD family)